MSWLKDRPLGLSVWLCAALTVVYAVLFYAVNWRHWSAGWLIPIWWLAMGAYAFHERIDAWGRWICELRS